MIPQRIQALFEFIDFLDNNKKEYIQKYIPICNKHEKIKFEQKKLKPRENYIDKQKYDKLQEEINKDFSVIHSNVYLPVINKLKELRIWSGDQTFSSIWNNNIQAISDFKRNFEAEDVLKVVHFKDKYLRFRNETNSNFLSLQLVFDDLDKILKVLFDFFKDSDKNEFEKFESKIIEVNSLEQAIEGLKNNDKNVQYSIPTKVLLDNSDRRKIPASSVNIKNEIIMGDKIEAKNISNKKGSINVGKKNSIETSNSDLDKKAFKWQKWGIIIAAFLAIITIVLMIII
uniref:Uncharacterized protein n=1 Tax=Roseihalotalea indica TaxID=2867963 RepID=A0AA49PZN0_9BACT|nr:hypothetical protein K4G66_16265 [Tunicatimonas sp. TK19036]